MIMIISEQRCAEYSVEEQRFTFPAEAKREKRKARCYTRTSSILPEAQSTCQNFGRLCKSQIDLLYHTSILPTSEY